jgi:hypothetical protein
MPRIVGPGSGKLRLSIIAVVVLFAFTPISKALLSAVDGSFAPSPYSSLSLRNPSDPATGYKVGDLVPVRVTNHTGSTKTYHWSATESGVVISTGERTLRNGTGATINVPTNFGKRGDLRIALAGTDIYVTLPLKRAGS